MVKKVITFIRQRIIAVRIPEGESGIALLGHRRYVGGQWVKIGKKFNWVPTYIGNWDHPRDQMMMLYTSK